jgi:hypothetical protein
MHRINDPGSAHPRCGFESHRSPHKCQNARLALWVADADEGVPCHQRGAESSSDYGLAGGLNKSGRASASSSRVIWSMA